MMDQGQSKWVLAVLTTVEKAYDQACVSGHAFVMVSVDGDNVGFTVLRDEDALINKDKADAIFADPSARS